VLAEADGGRAVGISSQIGWFRAETDKLAVNPHADILMTVNPLFVRLRVPADADTLAGSAWSVSASENRHLDFKRQLNNVDNPADDLVARPLIL